MNTPVKFRRIPTTGEYEAHIDEKQIAVVHKVEAAGVWKICRAPDVLVTMMPSKHSLNDAKAHIRACVLLHEGALFRRR